MNKLFINNNFIINITTFSETIDSSGLLKLVINEPVLEDVDLNEIEILLVTLKPYFENNSIEEVKIIDENNKVILETFVFTKMDIASLSFNEGLEHMTLDIVLI